MSRAVDTTAPALLLIGRALIAAIFLHEGVVKLTNYTGAVAYARAFGVPAEAIPLAIALELGCGVAILTGVWPRLAALLLAGFCIATALIFHSRLSDTNQLLHFEKNLAIAGGCLILAAAGAGRLALSAHRETGFGREAKTI